MMLGSIESFEIDEKLNDLLPSQREFVYSPQRFSCIDGGFASGKTRAGILKGLLLSILWPGNVGMILRFHGTDLEDTTIPVFFEVCPQSWIKKYNKKYRSVVLRNGSVILFRHLHDQSAQKKDAVSNVGPRTRRLGANLGWFFIDQMEEIELDHWNAMISRLRLPLAGKKFGFGAANPNGHDWIWKHFFPWFRPWKRDRNGRVIEFYQKGSPAPNILGVAVNSEENRASNGGFVEDAYFDSLLTSYPPEWVERYVYCSFDDFSGKIYKEFKGGLVQVGQSSQWEELEEQASVHIVEPFIIPSHWELLTGIDVGGAGKWGITPVYIDEDANLIVAEGYHKKASHTGKVASWIKEHLPWNDNRTRYVIDWENKMVALDLAQYDIHTTPANKAVMAGIIRLGGYFHVQANRELPRWYYDTQPENRIQRFATRQSDGTWKAYGSPRIFVFRSDIVLRSELDTYIWDINKPDTPYKTKDRRWDSCDALRYVCMMRPEASKLQEIEDKYASFAKIDPLSYNEWTKFDKRIAERMYRKKGGGGLREADMDEIQYDLMSDVSETPEYVAKEEF